MRETEHLQDAGGRQLLHQRGKDRRRAAQLERHPVELGQMPLDRVVDRAGAG